MPSKGQLPFVSEDETRKAGVIDKPAPEGVHRVVRARMRFG
jgi:hypothetical protein